MQVSTFIYGIRLGDAIAYVGQSVNPRHRLREHISRGVVSLDDYPVMVVFRSCDRTEGNRIELQIMLALKRKGQCWLNKSTVIWKSPASGRSHSINVRIQDQFGNSWPSMTEAARFFECCASTVRNNIGKSLTKNGIDHQITVK
jgi:hypothetical protein